MQLIKKPKIIVCGSINMDLVIRTEKLPVPGETLIAQSLAQVPGGKGANQAVAAARLGSEVTLIGRVGDDSFGVSLRESLSRQNISTERVLSVRDSSGVAMVAVDQLGENAILVIPGANHQLTPDDIEREEHHFRDADVVIAQLESPVETVVRVGQLARKFGKPFLLNPAPVPHLWDERLYQTTVLCPNQTEAESLLGYSVSTVEAAKRGAKELLKRGPENVIITLGADGAVACNEFIDVHIPPFIVQAVDTTAAGDSFMGALAYQWALNTPLNQAIRFACCAGALAATKLGAQPSLPTIDEVTFALKPHSAH